MQALITGGVGFIGQYVARELVFRGWEVAALDLLTPQVHDDPDRAIEVFPGLVHVGDVCEEESWGDLPHYDLVVHLAAETGTAQSMYELEHYRRVNVSGTDQVARWALAWQCPVIYFSSRAVYGEGAYICPTHGNHTGACCERAISRASREDDELAPVSVYGETKVEAEHLLATRLEQGVPLTIVRPQNVVGPGQALHNPYTGVLAAFLARLREGLPLVVYGDGSATRDFVHVRDVARLVGWLADHPPTAEEPLILNSGTGVRTSLTALAEAAAAGSPQKRAMIEHRNVHRAGDIDHACADLSRLRRLGAPSPLVSSRDAIIDFIQASWDKPGIASTAWDDALNELTDRGMTS